MSANKSPKNTPSMEENLKKAITELLILYLLSRRECYIGELTDMLHKNSNGVLSVVFPYGAIYRLLQGGFIEEIPKCHAPDGRRRQYYRITQRGQDYLNQLLSIYTRFTKGVADILKEREWKNDPVS